MISQNYKIYIDQYNVIYYVLVLNSTIYYGNSIMSLKCI